MPSSSDTTPSSNPNPSDQLLTSASEQAALDLRARKRQDYEKFKHYSAIGAMVLAPTLILMPPRKFDLFTVALTCGFVAGASQLSRETYGVGLIDLAGRQFERSFISSSPRQDESWMWSSSMPTEKAKALQNRIRAARSEEEEGGEEKKQGLLQKVWMGNEKPNWREERAKEHAEALERGETIGDLVRAQISEVWNWGEKKVEQLEEKDREVVEKEKKN